MQQTTTPTQQQPTKRILNQRELFQIVGFSKTTLWRLIGRGEFPKPIKLTEHLNAWSVQTINDWLTQRGL